jgi:prenyltransferase beta subunit
VVVTRRVFAGVCLLVAVAPALADRPDASSKATVAFLRKLQNPDGGFRPDVGKGPSSLRATSSGLRALKLFGGEPADPSGAAAFVRRCVHKHGGCFADVPDGKCDVTSTAVGAMAAVELKLPPADYEEGVLAYLGDQVRSLDDLRIAAAALEAMGKRPPQADAWRRQVERARSPDGTWGAGAGAARETGGAAAALLRLGGKIEDREAVLKALSAGQRSDGGFGKDGAARSDLESTYRVMRAYHMLGGKPDVGRLRAYLDSCHNEDGGYAVSPGRPSSAAGTYYAGSVLHWLDGR